MYNLNDNNNKKTNNKTVQNVKLWMNTIVVSLFLFGTI